MKIIFHYENGTSRIILQPENEYDKRQLELSRMRKDVVKLGAGAPDQLIIELTEEEKK